MFRERLFQIGAAATALYLFFFAYLYFNHTRHSWLEPRALSQSELGDFLAGIFGPLAVLWLIIGILLQGKEFRASVEQLTEQAKATNSLIENDLMSARVTFYRLMADIRKYSSRLRSQMVELGYAGDPKQQAMKKIAEAIARGAPDFSIATAAIERILANSILGSKDWADTRKEKTDKEFVDEFSKIDAKILELEKQIPQLRKLGREEVELHIQSAVFLEAELSLFDENLVRHFSVLREKEK
jgi:hypothetical protein